MKSFESGGQCSSPHLLAASLFIIDDTKVQHIIPPAKDKKQVLLSSFYTLYTVGHPASH
ncbi:MAG: hypothetical protein IT259_02110 [Saprospiraceae bacterium]|nr:hypothetical protein [Saprospiraceae bacterium]